MGSGLFIPSVRRIGVIICKSGRGFLGRVATGLRRTGADLGGIRGHWPESNCRVGDNLGGTI